MLLMALCASTMHERAWPHCLRLDTLGFYESMRSSNKRRCLLTRCSATTTVISSKSAQSTASYTIVAGVSLFLHRALLYWERGEASRQAHQMKRETEAAIDSSNVYRARLFDAITSSPTVIVTMAFPEHNGCGGSME